MYKGKTLLFLKNIKHKQDDLEKYTELTDQLEFRTNVILNELKDNDADFALFPSVNDIEALAENAFLVMRDELRIQEYE